MVATEVSWRKYTADDVKAKHVSQVQKDLWNNITKSCVYLQLNDFYLIRIIPTWNLPHALVN